MKCDGGISRLIRDALLVAVACVAFIACVVTVGLNYSNLLFDEKCYEAPCAPEKRLKSVHLVLMLTGIPSLIASVLVVVSYLCKRGWRRHPASLLVSRAIADGVWSAQLIGGTLYELTTGYLPNCAVVSPIVQFSLFASELYLAMLCVDLLLSSNDPFTSFVSNRRRFHAIVIFGASVATIGITVMPNFWSAAEDAQHGCPIYGPSHLTAMCWIRSGGRKHANDANPATWIFFYAPLLCLYMIAGLTILISLRRLSVGLSKTYDSRRITILSSMGTLLCFAAYWIVTGVLLIVSFALPSSTTESDGENSDRSRDDNRTCTFLVPDDGLDAGDNWEYATALALAVMMGIKGLVTLAVWLRSQSFAATKGGAESALSPHLNEALRSEILDYTRGAISDATRGAAAAIAQRAQEVAEQQVGGVHFGRKHGGGSVEVNREVLLKALQLERTWIAEAAVNAADMMDASQRPVTQRATRSNVFRLYPREQHRRMTCAQIVRELLSSAATPRGSGGVDGASSSSSSSAAAGSAAGGESPDVATTRAESQSADSIFTPVFTPRDTRSSFGSGGAGGGIPAIGTGGLHASLLKKGGMFHSREGSPFSLSASLSLPREANRSRIVSLVSIDDSSISAFNSELVASSGGAPLRCYWPLQLLRRCWFCLPDLRRGCGCGCGCPSSSGRSPRSASTQQQKRGFGSSNDDSSSSLMLSESSEFFAFEDVEPHLFRHLRELGGWNNEEYLASIAATADESFGEGASGAFMYFSSNRKLIVKSMNEAEFGVLRRIVRDYALFLEANPSSRLVRYLGLHSITLHGKRLFFTVMSNCLLATREAPIHEVYDLKGSWVRRQHKAFRRTARKREDDPHTNLISFTRDVERTKGTLKDNDLNYSACLKPGVAAAIATQLRKDVAFLAGHSIMDYSLVLGVSKCWHRVGGSDDDDDDADGGGGGGNDDSGDYNEAAAAKDAEADAKGMRSTSTDEESSTAGRDSATSSFSYSPPPPLPTRTHARGTTSAPASAANSTIQATLLSSSSSSSSAVVPGGGGTSAAGALGPGPGLGGASAVEGSGGSSSGGFELQGAIEAFRVEGPSTYYLGIIDCLQTYDLEKRAERMFKVRALGRDPEGISVLEPVEYARRFDHRVISRVFGQ